MKAEEFGLEKPYFTQYIQYKGVWDMQDLYESMVDLFRNQKFKFYEVIHKHKHPSPFGVERQYVWKATRNIEEYYQYVIDVFFHTYDARDVEVKSKDGSSKMFTKGRLWVQIRGRVTLDYEKKWEGNSFYAYLRSFYNKYIIQKKIESIWQDLVYYRVMQPLHNLIQQRLKMETEEYEAKMMVGIH